MDRQPIKPTAHYEQVIDMMTRHGLLLGSYDAAGKPNIMTIGWGSVGSVWGIPVWIVLVRPSRYSFTCIEHTGCFSVNVPSESMAMACATAGSLSGRDADKFDECELTAEKGAYVLAPRVAEAPIVYECQVVHGSDLLPDRLADEILKGAYQDGDYHRVYFGKILSAQAAADAPALLRR